jgi:hypothetical protein
MKLIDYIKIWDVVTIQKRKNDDFFPVYYKQAEELRAAVGDKPTIVWFSGSNGGFFGSGSFLAIDDNGEIIAEICCLVE